MTRTTFLCAALLLAACRPAGDAAKSGEGLAEGGAAVDRPTGRSGDPVTPGASGTELPSNIDEGLAVDAAALPSSLPPRFQGRWGLNANDCQPGRSDAKGLMVVSPNQLKFYESRGTLKQVDAYAGGDSLTATFSFTGEGMSWKRQITFVQADKQLRRSEAGGEEGPVDLTYTACPR